MPTTTPTRCKGRSSAGLVSTARPAYIGWRAVPGSNSAPFKTHWVCRVAVPHALLFSFLLSSWKGVLGQRTETAVRVKMRRNENTTLCCISRHSSHPALHLLAPICTALVMQPVVAPAKMEEIGLESVQKGHGKAAEPHNQSFSWMGGPSRYQHHRSSADSGGSVSLCWYMGNTYVRRAWKATLHFQAVSAGGSELLLQGNAQPPHASCPSWWKIAINIVNGKKTAWDRSAAPASLCHPLPAGKRGTRERAGKGSHLGPEVPSDQNRARKQIWLHFDTILWKSQLCSCQRMRI